jgi:hypothetical protein
MATTHCNRGRVKIVECARNIVCCWTWGSTFTHGSADVSDDFASFVGFEHVRWFLSYDRERLNIGYTAVGQNVDRRSGRYGSICVCDVVLEKDEKIVVGSEETRLDHQASIKRPTG